MTKTERNEYNYIKRSLRGFELSYGTLLTIRTDASGEYKYALHQHYTNLGFHPAEITIDSRRFDGRERVVYIYGLTWKDDKGIEHSWTELYTKEEKIRFADALN